MKRLRRWLGFATSSPTALLGQNPFDGDFVIVDRRGKNSQRGRHSSAKLTGMSKELDQHARYIDAMTKL